MGKYNLIYPIELPAFFLVTSCQQIFIFNLKFIFEIMIKNLFLFNEIIIILFNLFFLFFIFFTSIINFETK
jgi:hypothetical protein